MFCGHQVKDLMSTESIKKEETVSDFCLECSVRIYTELVCPASDQLYNFFRIFNMKANLVSSRRKWHGMPELTFNDPIFIGNIE